MAIFVLHYVSNTFFHGNSLRIYLNDILLINVIQGERKKRNQNRPFTERSTDNIELIMSNHKDDNKIERRDRMRNPLSRGNETESGISLRFNYDALRRTDCRR